MNRIKNFCGVFALSTCVLAGCATSGSKKQSYSIDRISYSTLPNGVYYNPETDEWHHYGGNKCRRYPDDFKPGEPIPTGIDQEKKARDAEKALYCHGKPLVIN
jgi:hypothetical protein